MFNYIKFIASIIDIKYLAEVQPGNNINY